MLLIYPASVSPSTHQVTTRPDYYSCSTSKSSENSRLRITQSHARAQAHRVAHFLPVDLVSSECWTHPFWKGTKLVLSLSPFLSLSNHIHIHTHMHSPAPSLSKPCCTHCLRYWCTSPPGAPILS